jgi:hypothetical protein
MSQGGVLEVDESSMGVWSGLLLGFGGDHKDKDQIREDMAVRL